MTIRQGRSTPLHQQTGTSSQEEYDESDSDEDQGLGSSIENVAAANDSPALVDEAELVAISSSDDLAKASTHVPDDSAGFTPQPNVFTHPPSHTPSAVTSHPGSYFPPQRGSYHPRRAFSDRIRNRPGHGINPNSPSTDHDAALRASLTTLLSCAAAARGLKKSTHPGHPQEVDAAARSHGTGLRLLPESELPDTADTSPARTSRPASSPLAPGNDNEAAKRKASAAKGPRQSKKAKRSAAAVGPDEALLLSPTLLGWVVSASVVVLVSVVGFGAGYALGKEVGRHEAATCDVACGREVIRRAGERGWQYGSGLVE
jgi:hypothetical protein